MAMAIGLRSGHTRSVRNELVCQSRCPTKILWHVHERCRAESARTHVRPVNEHTRPETGELRGAGHAHSALGVRLLLMSSNLR